MYDKLEEEAALPTAGRRGVAQALCLRPRAAAHKKHKTYEVNVTRSSYHWLSLRHSHKRERTLHEGSDCTRVVSILPLAVGCTNRLSCHHSCLTTRPHAPSSPTTCLMIFRKPLRCERKYAVIPSPRTTAPTGRRTPYKSTDAFTARACAYLPSHTPTKPNQTKTRQNPTTSTQPKPDQTKQNKT